MNWSLIIPIAILSYAIYNLDKRIQYLENKRGKSESYSFSVNVFQEVLKNKFLGELIGIASLKQGKEFKNWQNQEKVKFHKKYADSLSKKTLINLMYLASEKAFYVKTSDSAYIILCNDNKNLIYTTILSGDQDGFNARLSDSLELDLYERLIKHTDGNYKRVISGVLTESHNNFKEPYMRHHLFDFPYQDLSSETINSFEFRLTREGGDDIYEDAFGEMDSIPTDITYKKESVKINL